MQQDKHSGMVAGVKPHRISNGARDGRYGILRDEVWDELVRQQQKEIRRVAA